MVFKETYFLASVNDLDVTGWISAYNANMLSVAVKMCWLGKIQVIANKGAPIRSGYSVFSSFGPYLPGDDKVQIGLTADPSFGSQNYLSFLGVALDEGYQVAPSAPYLAKDEGLRDKIRFGFFGVHHFPHFFTPGSIAYANRQTGGAINNTSGASKMQIGIFLANNQILIRPKVK